MFCPECGSKNADDAVFCENCGANIAAAVQEAQQKAPQTGTEQSAEQIPQESTSPAETSPAASAAGAYVPAAKKARKPLKTSAKVTIAAVAAVVVAGIVLFQVGQSQCSPDKVAMDYFGSLQAQDWSTAYQKLDVGSSEFLTEKNFKSVQKQTAADGKITSYEVSPMKESDTYGHGYDAFEKGSDSTMMKHIVIQYMTKGSSSPKRQLLSLVKQQGKKWLFFDSWKVSTDSMVVPEITISAPTGITVSLNDIKLSSKDIDKDKDSALDSDEDGTVTYSVKKVFSGNYTIKGTSPNTEDFTHSMDIDDDHCDYSFEDRDLKLKQSVLDTVAKQPGDVMKALYSAALAGKDFSSVSSYFISDPEQQDLFKSSYDDIKKYLIATGTNGGFKSINFTSFDSKAENGSSSLNRIVVNTTVNYSFTAIPDSLFAETPPAPYSGKDSSKFQMEFQNEKGKWLVSDMSGTGLSFTNGYLDQN